MSDITHPQHSFNASRPAADRPAAGGRQADAPFLRRILFGLIAATIFSGAVTVALTTQDGLVEGLQVASAHGPA